MGDLADHDPKMWIFDAFTAAAGYDVDTLEQHLLRAWTQTDALTFLIDYAEPFLERIGSAWATGFFSIAQEHITSHKFRQFLSTQWETLARGATGPTVVLTTPEDELHELGLHMAAVVFGLADWSILFLGANTPTETILETVGASLPAVVGVGFAESYDRARARSLLRRLRDELPPKTDLLAGGRGAPADIEGVRRIIDLGELYEWASVRASEVDHA